MAGEICMSGEVIGARVKFEVNHRIYEGEVKMLSDGTMTAVGDFKPASMVDQTPPDSRFQDKFDTDRAINHSIAVFFAEKSGSKEILDPVWLDIGVVSVATAYHPKCGKVTFLIDPCAANGTDEAGYNVTTFTRGWEFDPSNVTLSQAKALVAENWSKFCKHHEPTIKPEPEWLQIKDCIWVCEHNGWTACLVPSANLIGQYIARAWKSNGDKEHSSPVTILPLEQAKTAILAQMI